MRNLGDISLRAAIPIGFALLTLANGSLAATTTTATTTTNTAANDAAAEQSLPQQKPEASADLSEIVVTGSHIARTADERLDPTTIITSEYMDKRSFTNVIDALQELPAFNQNSNSLVGAQSSFGVGQSFADFFSLGSQRTLTLVDGRRFVPANAPSIFGSTGAGGEQVDLNVIPTGLIDRIETIAVGGAPIYGSDAIAGTVNIILKHNFEGFQVDALGGISGHGDAPEERIRLLAGKNFADGRGNVEVSAEFGYTSGLNGQQRQRYADDNQFLQNPRGSPFQYTLSPNQRLGSINTQGVPLTDDGYLNAAPQIGLYSPTGQLLSFNHGALAPYNLGPVAAPGTFNIGGDGIDFARLTTLLSPQERTNATVLGNFDFNEHAKLYGELWFSGTHTDFPQAQSTYATALFGTAANTVNGNLIISANNPFLSAADQATIARNLAAYAAIPGNPTQTSVFYLSRLNQDIGDGGSSTDQNTKRAVLGIKGSLGFSDWNYDISGNYGQTVGSSVSATPNFGNYLNALNAVPGPNGPVCAPGGPVSPVPTQSTTCAPFNPFGFGVASAAAQAYVTELATAVSTLTQRDFNLAIDGTLFTLPGGPVKLAAGYENRRESADFQPDQFYQQGLGYDIPIGPTEGSFLTNEVFGELKLPVISPQNNVPFVRSIEIDAAAREVHHSVAGSATTWTAGLRFEPVQMVQFRGNYTRAIRAPSVVEAFTPTSQAFNTAADPCDQSLINSGPNPAVRAKNCAAAGIMQPFSSNILSFTAPITVAGDPTLQNEVADSRTFGVILHPLPRMTLSVDYISIDIENVIASVGPTDVLDACYDNPTYPNADCSRVQRAANGQVTLLQTGYANEGSQKFNGVQTNWVYGLDLGEGARFGNLDFSLNEFFTNHNTQTVGETDQLVFPGEIGYSKHRAVFNTQWAKGPLFALWSVNYTGKAVYDNQQANNVSQFLGVGAWWVNNLTVGYAPIDNLKLQLVVDNIFDKQAPYPLPAVPPTSNNANGSGAGTYFSGIMGRYFVLSASYKFDFKR
jgi:outer membrane receptor protein involved in Fe transport